MKMSKSIVNKVPMKGLRGSEVQAGGVGYPSKVSDSPVDDQGELNMYLKGDKKALCRFWRMRRSVRE